MNIVLTTMGQNINVVTVSTTLPRRCGIATFNDDVTRELVTLGANVKNVAMCRSGERHAYPTSTIATITQERRADYIQAATLINSLRPDVVLVEHEFGIYGGYLGEYILDLLQIVKVPKVTIVHTYPFAQTSSVQEERAVLLSRIAAVSTGLIAISRLATEQLTQDLERQGINTPIIHIPHGTPDVSDYRLLQGKPKISRKKKSLILATFGLIGERKGIADVIEILPKIVVNHSNVVYRILGAPHPADRQANEYLRQLRHRVQELNLTKHVQFLTRFLSVQEIMQNLQATDVYITFYHDPDQASSGTLAYALAAGCCVVSTPFVHARELLADQRGVLVPFQKRSVLVQSLKNLLQHDEQRETYRRRALEYGLTTSWKRIGQLYYQVLIDAILGALSDRGGDRLVSYQDDAVDQSEKLSYWH